MHLLWFLKIARLVTLSRHISEASLISKTPRKGLCKFILCITVPKSNSLELLADPLAIDPRWIPTNERNSLQEAMPRKIYTNTPKLTPIVSSPSFSISVRIPPRYLSDLNPEPAGNSPVSRPEFSPPPEEHVVYKPRLKEQECPTPHPPSLLSSPLLPWNTRWTLSR